MRSTGPRPARRSALLEAMAEGQISVEGRSQPAAQSVRIDRHREPGRVGGYLSAARGPEGPLLPVDQDRLSVAGGGEIGDRDAARHRPPPGTDRPGHGDRHAAADAGRRSWRVHVEPSIRRYILSIINRTREDKRLMIGVSPRGSLAMFKGSQSAGRGARAGLRHAGGCPRPRPVGAAQAAAAQVPSTPPRA